MTVPLSRSFYKLVTEDVRHLEETIADRNIPGDVYNFTYKIIIDAEAKYELPGGC